MNNTKQCELAQLDKPLRSTTWIRPGSASHTTPGMDRHSEGGHLPIGGYRSEAAIFRKPSAHIPFNPGLRTHISPDRGALLT